MHKHGGTGQGDNQQTDKANLEPGCAFRTYAHIRRGEAGQYFGGCVTGDIPQAENTDLLPGVERKEHASRGANVPHFEFWEIPAVPLYVQNRDEPLFTHARKTRIWHLVTDFILMVALLNQDLFWKQEELHMKGIRGDRKQKSANKETTGRTLVRRAHYYSSPRIFQRGIHMGNNY